MANLSDELRQTLVTLFCLGFWDVVNGKQLEDGDVVPSTLVPAMQAVAEIAGNQIDKTTDLISSVYQENPGVVHDQVYGVGRLLGDQVVVRAVSRN